MASQRSRTSVSSRNGRQRGDMRSAAISNVLIFRSSWTFVPAPHGNWRFPFQGEKLDTAQIDPPTRGPTSRLFVTGSQKMNTAIIKPQWSPFTIALMVLGFIVFWPLGLAMLAYIIWGEHFGGSAEK